MRANPLNLVLAAWLERKDTCVSSIYEAVQSVPEASGSAGDGTRSEDDIL